jgi:protein TonB
MATGAYISPILADGVSKERLIIFVIIVLAIHSCLIWLLKPQPEAQDLKKPANLTIELGKALPAAPAADGQEAPEPTKPEAIGPALPQAKLPRPAAPTSARPARPAPADLVSPVPPAPPVTAANANRSEPAEPPAKATALANPSQTSPAESMAARHARPVPADLGPPATPATPATVANATKSEPEEPTAKVVPKKLTESVRTAEPDYKAAYLNNPHPPYPRNAHRLGIEGTVILQAEVNEDGVPLQVRIFQSSGNDLLDESALNTVSKWNFKPARKDGVMVRAFVKIPITFSLRSRAQR